MGDAGASEHQRFKDGYPVAESATLNHSGDLSPQSQTTTMALTNAYVLPTNRIGDIL